MQPIDPGAKEASAFGWHRSPLWPEAAARHLAKEPVCACCPGPGARVQVHHIFPFHFCLALGRPDLELDERNLITLCATEDDSGAPDHHLLVGHLDSFQSANLAVAQDAHGPYHGKSAAEITRTPAWQRQVQTRLKPLDQFTPAERTALRQAMDSRFPPL